MATKKMNRRQRRAPLQRDVGDIQAFEQAVMDAKASGAHHAKVVERAKGIRKAKFGIRKLPRMALKGLFSPQALAAFMAYDILSLLGSAGEGSKADYMGRVAAGEQRGPQADLAGAESLMEAFTESVDTSQSLGDITVSIGEAGVRGNAATINKLIAGQEATLGASAMSGRPSMAEILAGRGMV